MKLRHLLRAAILVAILAAIFPLIPRGGDGEAAPLAEPDVREWTFGSTVGSLRSGVAYSLRNATNGKFLVARKREYGINLDWSSSGARNVRLTLENGASRDLRPGDEVALRVAGGGYAYYRERENGINLDFAATPKYEWELAEIHSNPPFGSGRKLALYNTTHGDYVVYGERNRGINLRWWGDVVFSGAVPYDSYPPLPFPPKMRGAAETGQMILKGKVKSVEVFHGGIADELDWHVYIEPEETMRTELVGHLQDHAQRGGEVKDDALRKAYCEWMVLDGIAGGGAFNSDVFFSADVTRVLALDNSAWSEGVAAARHEGGDNEIASSQLTRSATNVYLQGAFVNDAAHGMKPEIHPLDSIAYAVDDQKRPLPGTARLPTRRLTWRVAVFSNSTVHRIGSTEYVRKTRTTTWYLPLPGFARPSSRVTTEHLDFDNHGQRVGKELDDGRRTRENRYADYGVVGSGAKIVHDPATRRLSLKVTVTMKSPDAWGGMFLADYTVIA